MEKFDELTDKQLIETIGGARKKHGGSYHYYGNGVYCNKKHCYNDWGQAWSCIINRAGAAYATGGRATIGKC